MVSGLERETETREYHNHFNLNQYVSGRVLGGPHVIIICNYCHYLYLYIHIVYILAYSHLLLAVYSTYYLYTYLHYSALYCFLHFWVDARLHCVVSVLQPIC